MTIRHLDALLMPRSVAVIGASDRSRSVGATVWNNLHGHFHGPLYAVNLRLTRLGEVTVYPNVAALPMPPDLAVICTPPATVAALVAELGERGTHAAVVITAGLSSDQMRDLLEASRRHAVRILGPNCIGLLAPRRGLNASFAHASALPGHLAFVSQSGALVTAMLDRSRAQSIGFSHVISLGEHADVDFGDLLDYLGSDPDTRAILLYIESVSAPRKFMSAARAAARNKPVIVVKSGSSEPGQKAAASHTRALAGSDAVFDAAISRAGMLHVYTLQHLFLAAETLTRFHANRSQSLLILTNGGGAGVMAADAAAHAGIPLSVLDTGTLAELDAVLPVNWSHGNPVDIIGDAPAQRYADAMDILLRQADAAVLMVQAPTAIVPSIDIAEALLPLAQQHPSRLMACWLGSAEGAQARQLFGQAGVPEYDTPEEAVRSFAFLRQYHRHQAELTETPPVDAHGDALDLPALRALVDQVLSEGREWLTEPESKAFLAAAGLPVSPTLTVAPQAEAAVRAAETLGYPVVLKIVSRDITHKSDVGGVRLNLHTADEVRHAVPAMLDSVRTRRPDALVQGFTVQPMVHRPQALELIVGASIDPLFGPVILFGHGGTAVEVLADRALALPPLNIPLADALIERTRLSRLLQGYRHVPAIDRPSLLRVLVAVSDLMAMVPELTELDINPLLCDHLGVVALDARVRLSAACPGGASRFAIRPYPIELVERVSWQGQALTLRPIRPEDEAQHRAFFECLAPEDIRLRIFYSRRSLSHSELARLTQIDYEREMAFVSCRPTLDGLGEETLGSVRCVIDPDNEQAEFGIIVRSDLKARGLGHLLMQKMIRFLRERGTRRLVGLVLRDNAAMLQLAASLGFEQRPYPEDPGLQRIELSLSTEASGPR